MALMVSSPQRDLGFVYQTCDRDAYQFVKEVHLPMTGRGVPLDSWFGCDHSCPRSWESSSRMRSSLVSKVAAMGNALSHCASESMGFEGVDAPQVQARLDGYLPKGCPCPGHRCEHAGYRPLRLSVQPLSGTLGDVPCLRSHGMSRLGEAPNSESVLGALLL